MKKQVLILLLMFLSWSKHSYIKKHLLEKLTTEDIKNII